MKKRENIEKIIGIFFLALFLINFISASCTVTLDKDIYVAGETATVAMACSSNTEKNTAYNVNWTNQSGYQFELDSGVTPSVAGTTFYQSYTIPSTWPNGVWLNVSLNGSGLTILNNDSANVTASGSGGANTLEITNTTFGGGYLGLVSSIKALIYDENNKKISGGFCEVSGLSNDETKVLLEKTTVPIDGVIEVSEIMPVTRFNEGTDYAYKIRCYCGSAGSATECVDEDGVNVNNSIGNAKNFFTTQTWLTVNTLTDKSIYEMKNEIFICANVTNVNYTKRLHIPIAYEARCSAGIDNNNDLDRILIIDDGEFLDERGISANTTQMQCKRFVIPESRYLQGKDSQCYASTEVTVLNELNQEILSYHTTSSVFNITSNELNLIADWEQVNETYFSSTINLSSSKYSDYNGTGTGNIDVKLYSSPYSISSQGSTVNGINFEEFLSVRNIKNITATNSSGDAITWALEILEDGSIEVELRSVDISPTGYYNLTLELHDYDSRQTTALEGINNKTGTFHLDVNCPSTGTIGSDLACDITAYIEDQQVVQKEVDFTCYITDGLNTYSSLNFNQMITQTAFSTTKNFLIPTSFNSGQQYVLQCHADYYNFGSRRDSFYDTFTTSTTYGSGGTSTGITGGVIDEDGGKEKPDEGEEEKGEGTSIFEQINPFSPNRNWALIFIESVILISLIVFVISAIINKKAGHSAEHLSKKNKESIKKILIISSGIIGLIILISGVSYGWIYLKDLIGNSSTNISGYSLIQDSLIRGIILTAFIVLVIIVLSKALNIRGNIEFGKQGVFKKYDKQLREQRMLNKQMLKHELRNLKKKK